MSDLPTYEDEDDLLSGEYVLGTLDADARLAFQKRLSAEPALAERVAFWETYFASFNEDYAEVSPRARVKTELETQLFGAPRRWWQDLRLWVGGGLVAAGFALALFVLPLATQPFTPEFTAELAAPEGATDPTLTFQAEFDQDAGEIRVASAATDQLSAAQSFELWVIPAGQSPISLGVVETNGPRLLAPDLRRHMIDGATLAITLEPFGGSPSGAPTGEVVAVGALKTL